MLARSLLAAGLLLIVFAQSAGADGMGVYRHHRHVWRLPPDRHVIEKVVPPGGSAFLINGRYFTAKAGYCPRWVPGDRIRLVAGDWRGACTDALFYNLRRGSRCAMWC